MVTVVALVLHCLCCNLISQVGFTPTIGNIWFAMGTAFGSRALKVARTKTVYPTQVRGLADIIAGLRQK